MTASSDFTLRFVGDVDASLRREVRAFASWIRQWYTFPNPLEIRLLTQDVITGDDGQGFEMSWWQSERGRERVVVELAVGSLICGPAVGHRGTGCPGALAAVGRGLKTNPSATLRSVLTMLKAGVRSCCRRTSGMERRLHRGAV